MRVDALLCDFATVREGMLHILGGGVSRVWREQFPAPLGLTLAMLLALEPAEARHPHKLRIVLQDVDGASVAELDGQFGIQAGPGSKPGEQVAMPLVLNLHTVQIPKAGEYSLEVLLDGLVVRSMPFRAAPPAEQPEAGSPIQ